MSSRPAAGGGRWVEVDPGRVARWVEGFTGRHGPPTTTAQEYGLLLTAPDGATAELHTPPGASASPDVPGFVASATAARRLGLLLARKGAVAVGVADGTDLVVSKVDTRYVQGRTAAGGWSQQRFARRRDNQAKAALGDAAELAV
ncbi:acVLRF1 family peptidyl-tRNA hydrolase, partial [Micromonospora aurantiaca (nom. illeg.)]